MNILIRDVPAAVLAALDADAASKGISRQERLIQLLDQAFGRPPIVVAWLKADRNAELSLSGGNDDEPDTCVECGQPLDQVWIGVLSDGTLHMPVCSACATSE